MHKLSIHITSFSSISYYSNLRLILKMWQEHRHPFYILDIHVSTTKRPRSLFRFKPVGTKQISRHIFISRSFLSDLVLNWFSNRFKIGKDLLKVFCTEMIQKHLFTTPIWYLTFYGNLKFPTNNLGFLRVTRQNTLDFGQLKVALKSELDYFHT